MGDISVSKTMPGAQELNWLQVKTEHNALVAMDTVGAKKGDWVLMVVGDGAWRSCESCPVDAAVVGIVENNGNSY
jgi:microcompartment protein CcmK/EutM